MSGFFKICGGGVGKLPARNTDGAAATPFSPTPHRVVCSWCSSVISTGCEPVSHGICEGCFEVFLKDGKLTFNAEEGA